MRSDPHLRRQRLYVPRAQLAAVLFDHTPELVGRHEAWAAVSGSRGTENAREIVEKSAGNRHLCD
jgi:hypothetical protein